MPTHPEKPRPMDPPVSLPTPLSRRRTPLRVRPVTLAASFALGAALAACGGADAPDDAPPADPDALPRIDRTAEPLPEGAQAWSLLGQALFPPPLPLEVQATREENLDDALRDRATNPDDPETWIWIGRHHAYLGDYRAAVETFSEGFERFPADMRFLRHRGHRWITLRAFGRAREDLARATREMGAAGAEIEPDGLPNPAGIPLTTLAFNAWYHRALAEYLAGDFEEALASWEETLAVSDNPDLEVASRYWLNLTLRRLGQEERAREVAAAVDADAELLENTTYRDLLLHFRGDLPAEAVLPADGAGLGSVTALYGLGAHAFLSGDETEARRRFQQILERPDQWPAFGYVAAEVEVARHRW
jgi:tetratricopeptide (TPR) repeat protein